MEIITRTAFWLVVLTGVYGGSTTLAESLNVEYAHFLYSLMPAVICAGTAVTHKKTGGWSGLALMGMTMGFFGNPEPNLQVVAMLNYTLSPLLGFLASELDSFIWKNDA